MDERERRVAENEGIFREVNERIAEMSERFDVEEPEIVCECERIGCQERRMLPLDVYERVRAEGRRFLVTPGHENPEFERVVDQEVGWLIVEKIGEAGRLAEEADPSA